MNKNSIDFSELEARDIGSWPLVLRVAVIAAASIAAVFLVYILILSGQLESLDAAQTLEDSKRKEFKEKFNMAENLDAYVKQMAEMNDSYKGLLKQIPSDSNIPELIDNITKIADKNHLKFQSIKLGEAQNLSGFYKELPIDFILLGTYHNFGRFISDLSKLPRIVTLHDFTINKSTSDKAPAGTLVLAIKARTYWLSTDGVSTKNDKSKPAAPAAGRPTVGGPGAGIGGGPGGPPTKAEEPQ